MRRICRIKVPADLKIHNKKVSSEQTPAVTVQTSTTTKQMYIVTMQKPANIKLLLTANAQTSAATKQIHTTTPQKPDTTKPGTCEPVYHLPATPCPPMPAGQSPSTP
ncbi:hypothetical protein DSO57_1009512 [Entomophthora muscae]|uniref:Uncharacterized protein n=1 Tax=Entomophthora muscae TaxID=34485 RepID=A0ACC2UT36_9FUNG|nr:hypothetical protein DSO57_1009512 [Entomophthora muscae]